MTNTTHGAIETIYNGHRFRSRLEARWAVFFDAIALKWQYEVQGYEVDGHRYLPDFWLPDAKAWVEVKGDPNGLTSDFARMSAMLGPKSPLPGFADGKHGLIVLSEIPNCATYGQTVLHPFISRASLVLDRTWGLFIPKKTREATFYADQHSSVLYSIARKDTSGDMSIDATSTGWGVAPWIIDSPITITPILEAYRAARQARFEHGESGA